MNNKHILLSLFAASYIIAVILSFTSVYKIAMLIGAPALILAGWIFIGHLVTIDEEFPGGWSNPGGSKRIFVKSLGQLLIKFLVFVVIVLLVYLRGCSE